MTEPKKSKLAELVGTMDGGHGQRPTADEIDQIAKLPKREEAPVDEGFIQVNVKLPVSVGRRFKAAAGREGGQANLLERMLDGTGGEVRLSAVFWSVAEVGFGAGFRSWPPSVS